ncbi:hypothetical protein C482_17143 [Natrialba chahannaoensis JCM 10990]|uniref:Uncharacterized protein n=1 Tax=Natrialba chahannaoensis JCM 10990 TaxID=1227492 RepID=M0AAA6_9EURY|nr:3-keto-5-aminohexanoate cleavage protein [Natrialba chahannaoensis]ELY94822.1 hypothetical protein C482_17143 [Natrialba chahannaoensis JCM 10990]
MTCPFLEYRSETSDRQFDESRAYCEAAKQFIQPMRADICNDRYELAHDQHCEIYLEHADEVPAGYGNTGQPASDLQWLLYLAGDPVIITAALTGGVQGKEATPHLPETPEEIGKAAAEAEEADASVVHVHAQKDNGERTFATGCFQEIDDEIRQQADDVISQHSTPSQARANLNL